MKRVYVSVAFSPDPGDIRTYTYHQDIEDGVTPLKPDDVGEVTDHKSLRKKRVYVRGVTDQAPKFATKPVALYVPPPTDDDKVEF